jgi:hypothetical protein
MKIKWDRYQWEIDFFGYEEEQYNEAQDRFGGKKRSDLKDSDFLDSKKRSFPVMSCQDVRDAVSSWGRYTGSMTFEDFKGKLMRRAKSLGCEASLPKKWKEAKSAEMTKKQWDKVDEKELKRDSKKEKGEHEKDAVQDDEEKIKKLKKGKPSEKKKAEEFYLKRDEKFDKKNEKKDSKK